jgi:dTDP-4-dehydrorhamnose 3,5-epimerase
VLSDVADVIYRLNRAYDPELERGLAWDDPDLDIRWPVAEPILSERDRANPQLRTLNVE